MMKGSKRSCQSAGFKAGKPKIDMTCLNAGISQPSAYSFMVSNEGEYCVVERIDLQRDDV